MRLLCFFILNVFLQHLSAQEFTYKIYDSDGQYFQYKGHALMEHNEKLYVLGMGLDTTIFEFGERNLLISTFDLNGNHQSTALWDNPLFDDEFMITDYLNFHIHNGKIIIPYESDWLDCIVSIDTSLSEEFVVVDCDEEQGSPRTRSISTSITWPDDRLVVLQSRGKQSNFTLSSLDLNEGEELEHNLSNLDSLYNYFAHNLFSLDSDTLLVVGSYNTYAAEDRADHVYGYFVAKLDQNLQLIEVNQFGLDYFGNSLSSEFFLDLDRRLILSCALLDREVYNATGDLSSYSVIMELDTDKTEVLWQTPLDSTVFRSDRSFIRSITASHEKDGYIWVGSGVQDDRSLIYGKISKEGEMLWRKEIVDEYIPTAIDPYDVIATSDGYYMLTGSRSGRADDGDGFSTIVQLIMMKFDEEGNIITLQTDTEEIAAIKSLSIIPNPSQDEVLVVTNDSGEKQIYITDISGQLMQSEICHTKECRVDISSLVSGSYVVLVSDSEGEMIGKEQMVVQR